LTALVEIPLAERLGLLVGGGYRWYPAAEELSDFTVSVGVNIDLK
jgi:hypothetical protein